MAFISAFWLICLSLWIVYRFFFPPAPRERGKLGLICLLPTYQEQLPDPDDLKSNPLPFIIFIKKNCTWPGIWYLSVGCGHLRVVFCALSVDKHMKPTQLSFYILSIYLSSSLQLAEQYKNQNPVPYFACNQLDVCFCYFSLTSHCSTFFKL